MIRDGRLAGVVLSSDISKAAIMPAALIRRLQAIHRPRGLRDPMLVMIDQEGGLVEAAPGTPGRLGTGDGRVEAPPTAAARAPACAQPEGASGVNVDLAPVLDVSRAGMRDPRQHRSFGGRPRR